MRYRTTNPLDEPSLPDGDSGFVGVNELLQPSDLAPGEVASAQNNRCRNGKMEPRLGVAKLAWTNRVNGASPTPQPFGEIHGAAEFRDPSDVNWLVIAADGKVFRTREGNGASEVSLPVGVVLTGTVSFTQTTQGLVLFRGPDLPELLMASLDNGFADPTPVANTITGAGTENPSDGTEEIPPASNGEWIGNRLFIPFRTAQAKDLLGISDYLNATRYAPTRSQGRINQGSSDSLVRFFKFNENAGIAFKAQSIYILQNILGDLTQMSLFEFTREYGLAGPQAVAMVGNDVWFLSPKRGVCSIQVSSQGLFQGVDLPVSATLQKTIERIDWRNAGQACFSYWDNKLYAAVPLDDSKGYGPELLASLSYTAGTAALQLIPGRTYLWTKGANDASLTLNDIFGTPSVTLTESGEFTATIDAGFCVLTANTGASQPITASLRRVYEGVNNAILVYDFLKQRWAGYDTGSAIMVKTFVKTFKDGVQRLFFLSADGFINLVEESFYDDVASETVSANLFTANGNSQTIATTRGDLYLFTLGGSSCTVQNGNQQLDETGTFIAQTDSVAVFRTHLFPPKPQVQRISWDLRPEYIDHDWTSRAYSCAPAGDPARSARKRFGAARFELETWFPEFSLSAIVEGQAEEFTLVDSRTRSRTLYFRPWNQPLWKETNQNDDHARPFRLDYSVPLGETTTPSGSILPAQLYFVESTDVVSACSVRYNGIVYTNQTTFTGVAGVTTYTVVSGVPNVYGPGNYIFLGNAGLDPERHQDLTENFDSLPRRCRGRQVQFRIRNTQGRCLCLATALEGRLVDRTGGTKG